MSGVTKKLMGTTSAGGGELLAIEDVFSTYLYTGTGEAQTFTNGIDLAGQGGLVWLKGRSASGNNSFFDTERGAGYRILADSTAAQNFSLNYLYSFNVNGFSIGAPSSSTNSPGANFASWTFRKAPLFFDAVTYTGTGSARTVDHSLGTTVGFIMIKRTNGVSNWAVYHRGNTAAPETDFLSLNLTNATADDATYWNDTAPTDSAFTVGTNAVVNASGGTYVAYLFAILAGVSNVGSYTGNGTSQTINCGFTTGARFILIKRTDSTGDWYVWDTARGIVTGNDPHVSLNTTAAQVTTDDSVDPASSGFIVNQVAATNINVSAASYIFYAIA